MACSSSTMRFIQFLRRCDSIKRLGVISDDWCTIKDISCVSGLPNDFIDMLKLGIPLSEIEKKIKNSPSETLSDDIILLPPVSDPQKIVCIGLNYEDHCIEQNKTPPKEPMFFSKFSTALTGANGEVIAHKVTNKLDWEVELAVIIGKQAKMVEKKDAMDYVFGYTIAQDISARDWQKERNGGQFLIGKSMDTFCPLGPAITHKSLIKDVYNLNLKTNINGVQKQCGSTSNMIFKIDDIISRLSESITLEPGDIILTGTPKGVGMHRQPPEYLKPGDIIESCIENLGKMTNEVVDDKGDHCLKNT